MGAIVLLEKSQRVLNSIAVSPVKVSEYILSKVISIGSISAIVALVIAFAAEVGNYLVLTIATFWMAKFAMTGNITYMIFTIIETALVMFILLKLFLKKLS